MPRKRKPAPADPSAELDLSDPDIVRALARLEEAQQSAAREYTTHPWPWIRDCARTVDEIDGETKAFPDKPYLEYFVRDWWDHKLFACAKTRRMLISWVLIAGHYWFARTRPNCKIGFAAREAGTKEEEGSNELVKRAHFIHEHQVALLPPMDVEYVTGMMRFANGSLIMALPEGENKARQHTFTAFLADEFAHWRWARATYVGLKPTIDGGGRITLVSSALAGSFFGDVLFDKIGAQLGRG